MLRLTGMSPFAGKTIEEVIERNKACDIAFGKEMWKSASPEAIDLVVRMVDKDQYKRPSVKECMEHPWFSSKGLGSIALNHVTANLKNFSTEYLVD